MQGILLQSYSFIKHILPKLDFFSPTLIGFTKWMYVVHSVAL